MKQALTEALIDYNLRDVTPVAVPHLNPIIAAARLVERLLPGECEMCDGAEVEAFVGFATIHTGESVFYPCPRCHGSGQVWDEGIVETVAKAMREGPIDDLYHGQARAVLSVIAEKLGNL